MMVLSGNTAGLPLFADESLVSTTPGTVMVCHGRDRELGDMLEEAIHGHVVVRSVVPLGTQVEVLRQVGQQCGVVARGGECVHAPAVGRVRDELRVVRRTLGARVIEPHLQVRPDQEIEVQGRQEVAVRVLAAVYRRM